MSISQSEHDSVPHKGSVAVVVDTEDTRLVQEAHSLREKLKKQNNPLDYIVCFGSHGVDIRSAFDRGKKGQMVDFSTIDRRTGAGNLSKKQPFPKAIGSTTKTIIDATAGFGTDSAMLACMGYSVVAIERCPIISVLLRDGLFRALQNKDLCVALKDTLSFVEADSTSELSRRKGVDVVYLDPMFPPKRKKSALPQGSIQVLKAVVGYDDEVKTMDLFRTAMNTATKRVVVKRPSHAPLFAKNPAVIHRGKLVRYEVYKPNNQTKEPKKK